MKPNTLINKNCLITGATGGLGTNLTNIFADAGCNLLLAGRDAHRLKAKKMEFIALKNIRVDVVTVDLLDTESVQKLIKTAQNSFGKIDILINNAGVFPVASLTESTIEEFDRCFSLNVRAPFLLARAFLPAMVENKWGRIVNIGSSSAYGGFADTSIYCGSKHALLGLSRSWHHELKKDGVRTYCISPGSIKTKMGRKVKNQLFETFISPEEIAEFVRYVVSQDGSMVSEEIRLNRMEVQ